MGRFRRKQLTLLLMLGAVLVLRAAIPVGYMPSAAGTGLLVELCPEYLPSGFMKSLAGHEGHDHDGHEEGGHQCPVGHLLLSAAAVDDAVEAAIEFGSNTLNPLPLMALAVPSTVTQQPRGPPA